MQNFLIYEFLVAILVRPEEPRDVTDCATLKPCWKLPNR